MFESEGFGNNYFHEKKIDKDYYYFFKTGDQTEDERGFIVKMGKFSKNSITTEAESSYAVMSIEEISPMDMDSYLVDDAPYKSKSDEKILTNIQDLNKISVIIEKILDDYLQKAPKVVKIYDELLENLDIDREEYTNFMVNLIKVWSKNRWSAQSGSNDKVVVYNKLAHD